jgi:hypothetical protein
MLQARKFSGSLKITHSNIPSEHLASLLMAARACLAQKDWVANRLVGLPPNAKVSDRIAASNINFE